MKLSKQEKKAILKKIGDIIENHCRGCEFNDSGTKVKEKPCLGCIHYQELRRLGDKLEGRNFITQTNFDLTEQKYYWFKERRYTDKEIADFYNVTPGKIDKWKRKHGIKKRNLRKVGGTE